MNLWGLLWYYISKGIHLSTHLVQNGTKFDDNEVKRWFLKLPKVYLHNNVMCMGVQDRDIFYTLFVSCVYKYILYYVCVKPNDD